ncbi:hypothetical protein BT96DRAFT_946307 [Gymnopus androsaceus JB14]|uniref:Uncharacterized protein n=1 Tax=Gymnopus androsaceus JB14 TaxID=1447944 RepID=A0A6A4GWT2_9AGAR|nr:hypothetical protein BT96DRAFT_946307 [Gymnopus androsaceus JB14]
MDGRRAVIQMIVGGMTQYMASVQGMPLSVEKQLEKRINIFMWKGKERNPVNQKVVTGPLGKGGTKVLDIKIRNEAIKVMWLKAYLYLNKDRGTWAFLADGLLAMNVPLTDRSVDPKVQINVFLQSWQTYQNSKNQIPGLKALLFSTKRVKPED